MEKKLKLHFSKPFDADIWEQSICNHQLLLTTRDSQQMSVSFSLANLTDGSFVFEQLAFEENWWVSVYHFFNEVAVFQVFEDTQDIEARSYFALDLRSQEALWSLDAVAAMSRQGYFIQVRAITDESEPFWIDIRSGETLDSPSEEIMAGDISYAARYPLHYTEEGEHFQTVKLFLSDKYGIEAIKACDYLEYGSLAIIAYHSMSAQELEHFLLVLTKEGEALLHEKLDSGLKGLISGAFFIAEEQLIFVQGRKTLKSYLIA
ncbi:MAG: DUF4905 domain-containing protein [Roseivirga sp.]|nr:DUF4905 domain-containing protein [Roseivirga sp.]